MIKFEDYISDTCKRYFEENPDQMPTRLAQIQYLLEAYWRDVSDPPALDKVIEFVKANITIDDPFYDDAINFIDNIREAIADFKKQENGFVYLVQYTYIFASFEEVMSYVEFAIQDFKKDIGDKFKRTDFDHIKVDKIKMYNSNINMQSYSDFSWSNNRCVDINIDGDIVNISSYKYNTSFSREDFPNLSVFQPIKVPYKKGDILDRRGPSIIYEDYYRRTNCYMMMYDIEEPNKRSSELDFTDNGDEQISMGIFSGRMFEYDHMHCVYEFDLVDIDDIIRTREDDFWKRYYENIKDISIEVRNILDFSDSLNLAVEKMNKFTATIDKYNHWFCRY